MEPGCRRKVFTEPLPGTVSRYGRRSCRSSEALRWLTLALGGRAGARLAERLGLLASRSTLLRQLHHRRPVAPVRAPRVLGIDDWAWRKGHRYGTILCDLETRKVVDLLPDRDANSVAAWLRQHPGTEIISRDRGGIYAEAARRAVPQAVQVADRWHLLRNLSEALFRAIAPHHRLFSQAAKAIRPEEPAPDPAPVAAWSQRELLVQQANRQRRYERWEQVRELFLKTGAPDQELARQLGLDPRTVKKFRTAVVYPEAKPRVRESIVDDHASYLDRRLKEGCRSSTRLWRELREQGFRGQVNSVRYWLRQRRSYRTRAASPPQRPALRASHDRSYGSSSRLRCPQGTFSKRYTRSHLKSAESQNLPQASFASSANAGWRRCPYGFTPHEVPPWKAAPQDSNGTLTPCVKLSGSRGARATSKARSTDSSSSNARCTAEPASSSCASVS